LSKGSKSRGNRDLSNQLKTLNESIDLLTKVTAISVGKDTIFKSARELSDKIEYLDMFDLPDKTIAMLVGSTPDSVKTLRSKMKKTQTRLPQAETQLQEADKK
jgi:CRP-like cAMP-binding protein